MTRMIHALLIAIDDYPRPIPSLQGCVNDIDAFASYLSERVNKASGITLNRIRSAEPSLPGAVAWHPDRA